MSAGLRISVTAVCALFAGGSVTAEEPGWWSLRPLRDVAPPAPPGIPAAWAASPIDRFVFAKLMEKGLTPSPPADRFTLIRRVTFDLTGLPPTPEEVAAFVNDPRPDAYERLVERLLASPAYGERWGRHWLDVVRFGESTGFERNVIIDSAWPFRDYVIRSFNADKPFDRLVLEHLAGDLIAPGSPDGEVGTAFLVVGPYDNVGNLDPVQAEQIRHNTIDDMIQATSGAFLGLTVGCARCHDHKYDPIPQADYYRMQAAFAGVFHGERVIATSEEQCRHEEKLRPLRQRREELARERAALEDAIVRRAEEDPGLAKADHPLPPAHPHLTEDRFEPVRARFVRLTAFSTDHNPKSAAGLRIDEFEVWAAGGEARNVALQSGGAAAEGTSRVAQDFAGAYAAAHAIDGSYGAHWISAASPARLTVTLARPEVIDRVTFSSDRNKSFPGRDGNTTFVGEYRIDVSLDGTSWTKVADSSARAPINDAFRRERLLRNAITPEEKERLAAIDREIAAVDRRIAMVPPLRRVWAGTFRQPEGPTHVLKGGDPTRKGETVRPASLSVLDGVTEEYALPPEVSEGQRRLALACWIVMGDNPLTPRVLANRVWHYHFGTGIVDTPSDFGKLGGPPTHPELLDWLAKRLLQHGSRLKPLHRDILLSQTYRQSGQFREDAARVDQGARFLWRFPPRRLAAEEVRDTILHVAGKLDRRTGGPGFRLYRYLEDNVATYVPLDEHGPETFRRAVYHQNARAARVDLLSDFDCPDNAFAAPKRNSTTTPMQALTLMNHRFTLDMAQSFAERLRREAGDDVGAQVRRAFALAYSRPAAAEEVRAGVELVRKYGLIPLCRAILNSNEFIYLE